MAKEMGSAGAARAPRVAAIAFWSIATGLTTLVAGLLIAYSSFMTNGALYMTGFVLMLVALGLVSVGLVLSFFVRRADPNAQTSSKN